VTVRFHYDAMNRRVARQDGSGWIEYVHDPSANLLAEVTRPATAGGAWSTKREYVWLDGQPLAQLEYPGPAGRTDGYTYYFHLDHLGQPRALTSESGATVWNAVPARPYGDVSETTWPDPLNGRTVVTNLRLPGQYDERLFSGLGVNFQGPFYNWNRWYLPTMGRYLELDPIAVSGGFNGPFWPNWYGYAEGNPLRWLDPLGLWGVGVSIDLSTIQPLTQGWGGTYGWNLEYTSEAGWAWYNYSTPDEVTSFGFLLGPSLQANLAIGNGDWTGPFESCGGSAGPFAFGTFRSPNGTGHS
jgi:RHS repeat-associated protein